MKILFEINHPSRVHNFKHVIHRLEEKGHQIKICAVKKEVTYNLLDSYNFTYEKLGENEPGGILKKIPFFLGAEVKMLKIASEFKPDLFVSSYSPISAIANRILNKKHLAFHDTENTKLTDMFTAPFTNIICTPDCFKKDYGKKHVRFKGYKELCYLHPKYFKPDPEVLDKIGVKREDPIITLRLVSFSAHHDIGQKGIENPLELIKRLEKHGKVILSSETKIPELEKYQVKLPPKDIHSLLFYSKIYIGDGATMATEAGVLGTPSIYISTFKGTLGNFIELENKYQLVYSYRTVFEAMDKVDSILNDANSKNTWHKKRIAMLEDTIDVNEFLLNLIEGEEPIL